MRKVIALILMAMYTVTILYILFGIHFTDIQERAEQVRLERSQWLSAPGTILQVRFHDAFDDNDKSRVTIKFQYNVLGVSHVTQQEWNDDSYAEALKNANSYRTGTQVTVYYDPTDAKRAAINRESVDLYEVSKWWEVVLRILAFPSIVIGCAIIWDLVTHVKGIVPRVYPWVNEQSPEGRQAKLDL